MEIEEGVRRTIIYSSPDSRFLTIPILKIDSAGDVMVAITEHFNELPDPIATRIVFPGEIETDVVDMAFEKSCNVVFELTALVQTDEGLKKIMHDIVVLVIYDEGVLNFVIGKLNFSIGPDTLISTQIGHA